MASAPIKIKRIPRPTHKAKTITRLTSRILGGVGVTVTRSGLDYTIASSAVTVPDTPVTDHSIARFDGVTGSVIEDSSATISDGGTLDINPTALSNNQGINISQTSPTSGTVSGPLNFNEISINNQGGVTTSGSDPFATHEARGLSIHMTAGGANLVGFQNALRVRYDHTLGTSDIGGADHIAAVFIALSDQDATSKGIYAINPLVKLESGAVHGHTVGSAIQVIAEAGSSATHRVGQRIYGAGPVQGSVNDAAITVVSEVAGWKNLIHFGELFDAQSLDTTASFFASAQAMTVENFASLANVTFTGNIMDFPNYSVSGAGAILGASLGLGGALVGSSKMTVTGTNTSSRVRTVQSDGASSTTGFTGLDASSDTSEFVAITSGSARTTTRYGLTLGGWAEVSVFDVGAGTNGLIIGTNPNKPIVFGTNDTERMRLGAGLSVGATSDPGAGIIHTTVGIDSNGYLATGGTGVGTGEVRIGGNTSGTVKLTAQATAGTPTITFGTSSGTPAVTASSPLAITAATGNIAFDSTAWASYSPTVTSQTGTITTLGTVHGAYMQMGKTVFVRITIAITTNGTGATAIEATLPVTAKTGTSANHQMLYGMETLSTGFMVRGFISATNSTKVSIKYYDNTYPGADSRLLAISGSYEAD